MADDTRTIDNNGFAPAKIRSFLLGRLAVDEREVLERRLFSDPQFEEQVSLAEFELADDYSFGRLTAAERLQFESSFSVSVARRQQLMTSQALRESSLLASPASLTPTARSTARELIRSWFGIDRPLLGYALAFGILFLVVGIVWVVWQQPRSNDRLIATREPTPSASPAVPRPTQTHNPVVNVSPEPNPKPSPLPDLPGSRRVVATFVLSTGAVRDSGDMTRIDLPPGERGVVRLQLKLDQDELSATKGTGSYGAELVTAEGRVVFVRRALKGSKAESNSQLAFDVPRRLLKAGDYQVKLTRTVGPAPVSAGRYYVRLTD